MQDTFRWTPELIADFFNYMELSSIKNYDTLLEQFKASKAPKKEWEVWLTEDGVEVPIVEGNKLFYVETFTYKVDSMTFSDHVNVAGIRGKFPQFKYFSTREAAEKYILDHAPKLSLNDVKETASATVKDYWLLMEALSIKVKQKLNQ